MNYRTTWSNCRPALLLFLLCVSGSLQAARSLYWQSLQVEAKLDAAGSLHVRERHHLVFTGDWNGGERTFRLNGAQTLQLIGMIRIDPGSATRFAMTSDSSLARVDEYYYDGRQLRWRARTPADPPFSATGRIYEIDYILNNVLNRNGDNYWLDHDFAFPERRWPIRQFTLNLSLDKDWQVTGPWTGRLQRDNLAPGTGVVTYLPLHYLGTGSPAAIARVLPPREQPVAPPLYQRIIITAGLLMTLLVFALRYYREESAKGIFAPLPPPESVNGDWLEEHVFTHLPEVIGAAWDERTAAPEVVALLARMEQEGKLSSTINEKRTLFSTRKTLALTLRVPMKELTGYERKLAEKLFIAGNITTTDQIRRHYRRSGFDPAGTIRNSLKRRVDHLASERHQAMNESYRRTLFLFLACIPLLLVTVMLRNNELLFLLGVTAPALPLFLFSRIKAGADDMIIVRPRRELAVVFTPMLLYLACVIVVILRAPGQASVGLMLSAAVFCSALFSSVFNGAGVRASAKRIELRRRLATARAYFNHELRQPAPALRDQWVPYVLAFGLGPHVDRWFRRFGAMSATTATHGFGGMGGNSSSGSGSVSMAGGSWSGGGGSFGGAGSSASWVSAVGTIASGVSGAGSGGSGGGFSGGGGGGGGGGGSSGGGGGGGW